MFAVRSFDDVYAPIPFKCYRWTSDCDLRDGVPLPRALPEVVHRGGVDLSPIDPADPDSRDWLRSRGLAHT
jgi:hypothetical protein